MRTKERETERAKKKTDRRYREREGGWGKDGGIDRAVGRKKQTGWLFLKCARARHTAAGLAKPGMLQQAQKKALRCCMQVPENSGWRDLEKERNTAIGRGALRCWTHQVRFCLRPQGTPLGHIASRYNTWGSALRLQLPGFLLQLLDVLKNWIEEGKNWEN